MNETAKLVAPSQALSSFIFTFIVRDTRTLALPDHARLNRFPASPLCAVSWIIEGETQLVGSNQIMPRLSFSGPQTQPTMSYNPAAVYAVTAGIYPEAWQTLTGIDISGFIDQTVPLETIIGDKHLSIFKAFFELQPFSTALSNFENDLEIEWQKTRPNKSMMTQKLQDWFLGIASQSSTSGAGKSLRQIQRRFKSLTGQRQRDVAAYARMENLFTQWIETREDPASSLAGLATAAGFSDQSHMGREVKKMIGLSPARLNQLIKTDESFWFYRLLDERI